MFVHELLSHTRKPGRSRQPYQRWCEFTACTVRSYWAKLSFCMSQKPLNAGKNTFFLVNYAPQP